MTYKEFLTYCEENGIEPTSIDVYITDIQRTERGNESSLLRDIRAEKVRLVPKEEVPKRTVYYADHILQRYGKKDELVKQYYAIFDNKGRLSKSVKIFLTKQEAVAEMKVQIKEIENFVEKEILRLQEMLQEFRQILEEE